MSPALIRAASTDADIDNARALFREYADGLGVDLCFQNFENELRTLPGAYAPPHGTLLLAGIAGELAGCVAVRPLDAGIGQSMGAEVCELKRLYVRSAYRSTGLGRELTVCALNAARRMGYARIRLDTLPGMQSAQRLYESLGFYDIPPYYDNPIPGKRCLEAALG